MWKNSQIIINCVTNCFRNVTPTSRLSAIASERENNPEEFIKRVAPQIIECYSKHYSYDTPEHWDESFYLLGGGQKYRRSNVILKRMSWEQFLYNIDLVIKEYNSTKI